MYVITLFDVIKVNFKQQTDSVCIKRSQFCFCLNIYRYKFGIFILCRKWQGLHFFETEKAFISVELMLNLKIVLSFFKNIMYNIINLTEIFDFGIRNFVKLRRKQVLFSYGNQFFCFAYQCYKGDSA